jgi:DNA-binding response OmpR family regulator
MHNHERTMMLDSQTGVCFDKAGTRLRRGLGSIALTLTEFHLLRTLTAVPGTTIRREDLLREASRDGHIGNPRNLDSHIRRLRLKIEPNPSKPIILITVPSIGYRIDPR